MSTVFKAVGKQQYVEVGLVYRYVFIYRSLMRLLYRSGYARKYQRIADAVPAGLSVVDLCCGDCVIAAPLHEKKCNYIGMDINRRFLDWARKRGVDARFWDGQGKDIPAADVVCMQSSLYQFMDREDEILDAMLSKAREMVIISEPVVNITAHRFGLFRWLSKTLTAVGGRSFAKRYDLASISRVADKLGAWHVVRHNFEREVVLIAHRNKGVQ